MASDKVPMLAEGHRTLTEEVKRLRLERPEIIDSIEDARAHGDLSENAEYHAAKEDQERMESRISEIEHILVNSEVVARAPKGTVGIGNSVTLKNSGKKEVTYHIVDSVEADPMEAKISNLSRIGQALLGKKVGEKVEIVLPAGKHTFEIKEIK